MFATPNQLFDRRVVAIIGHLLPSELPPDASLSEFGLDGNSILMCEVVGQTDPREVCPHAFLPWLDDDTARWRTFRHVMASCTWYRLPAITLGRNGWTSLVTPYRARRNFCGFPLDFDLTRVGLNRARSEAIYEQLTRGNYDDRGRGALCRPFPSLLLTMCRTSRQIINLAHGRALCPKQIAPEVLPVWAA